MANFSLAYLHLSHPLGVIPTCLGA